MACAPNADTEPLWKLWKGLSAPCQVCSMLGNDTGSLRRAEWVRAGCQRRRRRRWQTWWPGASASPSAARALSSALRSSPASCPASRARPPAGPRLERRADSSAPAAAPSPSPPRAPRPSRAAATRPNRLAAMHRNHLAALRPDQPAAGSHALRMAVPRFRLILLLRGFAAAIAMGNYFRLWTPIGGPHRQLVSQHPQKLAMCFQRKYHRWYE